MAKSFKDMTAAQRREARKVARLNKQKARDIPQPRFTAPSSGSQPKYRVQPSVPQPRGAQPDTTDINDVIRQGNANDSFEEIFLSIIQFLPPDQQGRAFSLFSVFRQQAPGQQKQIIDSLMNVAREQTGPLFDLMKERIQQDRNYNRESLVRQENNAKALYDRLVQVTDTNAVRAKAKEDRSLAKVVRDITSQAFVTRVNGSGIQKRRTRDQIEEAAIRKKDIDIEKNQQQTAAYQKFGQIEQNINAQIQREDQLQARDLFDTSQDSEEAARTLFLTLFENQFSQAGDVARDNIETGDVPVNGGNARSAGIRDSLNLYDSVFSGGTDEQRYKRAAEEKRVANALQEDQRIQGLRNTYDKAASEYLNLSIIKDAMMRTGQDTTEIDAVLQKLRPFAQQLLTNARGNNGSIFGESGAGLSSNIDEYILGKVNHNSASQYGSYGKYDQRKVTDYLAGIDIPQVLSGVQSLANSPFEYIPEYNQYGSTKFNESLRTPNPQQRDVLSSVPTSGAQQTPVSSLSSGTKRNATLLAPGYSNGLSAEDAASVVGDLRKGINSSQPNPELIVVNPNTGVEYTGAASKRLSKRLAR